MSAALNTNLMLPFTGIIICLVTFWIGQWLFKISNGLFIFHPLFVGMILGIVVLVVWGKIAHLPTATVYTKYFTPGGNIINWFLQPATIAFAVPLFKRNDVVKKFWLDIFLSLIIGSVISLFIIFGLSKLFGLSDQSAIAMTTQPATLAIATQITTSLGGEAAITSLACILNAVIIYAMADILIKVFRLRGSKIGLGLGLGTAGHTVGSAKGVELGSVEGAMASISVVIISIVMNIVVPPFVHLFM
ncbi:antiholin LrgB [Limosilactobacillus gastricus]|uniref:LrgB family protein n=1 Tax=Limosilactobacillus gastricus DSM 16045 TaxID=1423749 RepID=A0A0R1V893_9LACO|nr:LrgB family protein [Limosilactobacillus gastricus]KRM01730.1 LrgB family protein [Limosilactobacillus gastricus DSM 16045]QGF39818.1 antiholin LrgB [Limosilactobacillus gastricus]